MCSLKTMLNEYSFDGLEQFTLPHHDRFRKVSEIEEPFQKEGWEQECIDGEVIEAYNESMTDSWNSVIIYGFAVIDGQRRHVRRVVSRKGKQVEKIRMVYDWQP